MDGSWALHLLVCKTRPSLFPALGNGRKGLKQNATSWAFICFLSEWGKIYPWFALISVYHCITECLPGQEVDTATSPKNLCALCWTRCIELQVEMFFLWGLPFCPAPQADGWWYWGFLSSPPTFHGPLRSWGSTQLNQDMVWWGAKTILQHISALPVCGRSSIIIKGSILLASWVFRVTATARTYQRAQVPMVMRKNKRVEQLGQL